MRPSLWEAVAARVAAASAQGHGVPSMRQSVSQTEESGQRGRSRAEAEQKKTETRKEARPTSMKWFLALRACSLAVLMPLPLGWHTPCRPLSSSPSTGNGPVNRSSSRPPSQASGPALLGSHRQGTVESARTRRTRATGCHVATVGAETAAAYPAQTQAPTCRHMRRSPGCNHGSLRQSRRCGMDC